MSTDHRFAGTADSGCPVYEYARFHIYGRFQGQKKFRAMDINEGYQVRNVLKATILTKAEADKFMATEAPRNPEWEFEAREIYP